MHVGPRHNLERSRKGLGKVRESSGAEGLQEMHVGPCHNLERSRQGLGKVRERSRKGPGKVPDSPTCAAHARMAPEESCIYQTCLIGHLTW